LIIIRRYDKRWLIKTVLMKQKNSQGINQVRFTSIFLRFVHGESEKEKIKEVSEEWRS